MKQTTKAAFKLENYHFNKVLIDFDILKPSDDLDINFNPSGKYIEKNSSFTLKLVFTANARGKKCIEVECDVLYLFQESTTFLDIPQFFYTNSIAIIFPYVRAFISTLTLQANYPPVVLPTLNLSALESELIKNTYCEK